MAEPLQATNLAFDLALRRPRPSLHAPDVPGDRAQNHHQSWQEDERNILTVDQEADAHIHGSVRGRGVRPGLRCRISAGRGAPQRAHTTA